jgi:hypothetical protein
MEAGLASRVMTIEEICGLVQPKKAAASARATERSMTLKALGINCREYKPQ